MNFTEAVKKAVENWCNCDLTTETKVGKANQVDFTGLHTKFNEIRIELERRKEDPLNNVVKAWRQASQNLNEEFLLIHIFSGFYISKKSKYENAVFVGKQINSWAIYKNRNIIYLPILLDYIPLKGDSNPIVTENEAIHISYQVKEQIDNTINNLKL